VRVLIYVQHLLGIGHLARISRIAAALSEVRIEVTLVSGGVAVAGFPKAQVKLIQLPAIRSRDTSFSELVDAEGKSLSEEFKALRRDRLLAALQTVQPDVLVIEAYPFGRRQMRFELIPLLEAAKAKPNPPLVASSVRDILQESRKAGRAEETIGLIERFFDLVLVHGDPRFARFEGIAGRKLVQAAAEAAPQLMARWPRWCIITGPNFPEPERSALAARLPPGVTVETFRPDFPGLLANAELSVSQAGYNTVCDILRARCRAVLIPFAEAGETEQSDRAERLERLGIARVAREDRLTAESLAQAMLAAPNPKAHAINLDGAKETARLLQDRFTRQPAGRSGGLKH
jgi:predicted glycosyltransferase